MASITPTTIIGVGSPAGDDRLGWEVIARLQQRLPAQLNVELIALDRPGSGLIPLLQGSDGCWLIDAIATTGAPGRHLQPDLSELAQVGAPVSGSHGFGVAESLQLAATLGVLPAHLELHCVTIGTANLLGEQLSPAVDAGVDGLVQRFYQRLVQSVDHTATFKGGVGSTGSVGSPDRS
jgi:hydrogenase maturation protease